MSLESLCRWAQLTIQQPTQSVDASGGVSDSYTVQGTGYFRIQPLKALEITQLAQANIKATHRLFSTTDPRVGVGYRFGFGARTFYFRGQRNADELNRLWIIIVEELPGIVGA